MKTILYYFTGTGNSLAAARKIAAAAGNAMLVPIASVAGTPDEIVPDADRIGIICPVYFTGLPAMVASFAARLRPAGSAYVFSVVTHGGGGGAPALRQLDRILIAHGSRGLDAGFMVKMPGNYILMYSSPEGDKRAAVLAGADEEIARIADAVRDSRKSELPGSLIGQALHALIYPWFASKVHGEDRKFRVSDACTSCGTCRAVCPAKNIRLEDGKPVWLHRCELCCSCIHTCPARAIQAKKTEGRVRYRNPEISVADLVLGNRENS